MGDETRPRLAALDGQRRHLGLDLRIAALAGKARLDMTHDTKRGRDVVENLADALACADEVGTATDRACAICLIRHVMAWQMIG